MIGEACCVSYLSRERIYRIAGNIGGELYLADWWISCHTTNINIAPTRVDSQRRRGDRTEIAKFVSANCNFLSFSSNPPNIIPANISGYTLVCYDQPLFRKAQYNYVIHHNHKNTGTSVHHID